MERYPIRVVKYFVYLTVLLSVVLGIFYLIDANSISFNEMKTTRGLLMFGVIFILVLLHPVMGYVKKTLVFDANQKGDEVDKVMNMCGYTKILDTPQTKQYRATTLFKRLNHMFEDQITITTADEVSIMTGPRKDVVRAYFRMGTFIAKN